MFDVPNQHGAHERLGGLLERGINPRVLVQFGFRRLVAQVNYLDLAGKRLLDSRVRVLHAFISIGSGWPNDGSSRVR